MSTPTSKDLQILAAAWQCFDTQPKVNYAKLAEVLNYKNAQTANVMFNKAKRALLAGRGGGGGGGGEVSPAKGAKGTPKGREKGKGEKRGRESGEEGEDDDEGLGEGKKVKKSKVKGGEEGEEKASVVKKEEDGDWEAVML